MIHILKRLEIIKSSIAIEDEEIIALQMIKLRQLGIDDDVKAILKKLENMNYAIALKEIETYLARYGGLVEYVDSDIQGLKLELKALESKLQELVEQKTDYLNDIEEFNREYNLYLGELIKEILNLKKEILYKKTIKQQKAKEKYKEEKQTFEDTKETIAELTSTIAEIEDALENIDEDNENYKEFTKAYNELKEDIEKLEDELERQEEELEKTKEFIQDEDIQDEYKDVKSHYEEFENEYKYIKEASKNSVTLSDEEKKELKKLFKKTARLCHPDIVIDELKEKAHELMQKLNEAYSKQDLLQVKKILHSLETGTRFEILSDKINDKEILKEKIKEFREELQNIQEELEDIQANETFQTIAELNDWDKYFEELRGGLEEERKRLEDESRDVLKEKREEESEEWIQTLWDWAEENNVKESNVYYMTDEENQYLGLGGWNFVFTYAKNLEDLLLNLGVKNSTEVKDYYEQLNEYFSVPIFRDYYYGQDSWQIEKCFELYTGISKSTKKLTSSTFIDLSNKNLDFIPIELFNIRTLTHLDISNNNISILPEAICNLSNLRVLGLSNTKIGKLPDSIINLSSLEELYICTDGIKLTVKQKKWIERLKHYEVYEEKIEEPIEKWMQTLWDWADENNLEDFDCESFYLDDDENPFFGEEHHCIGFPRNVYQLLNFETLELGDENIRELSEELSRLRNLKYLILTNNPIKFLPTDIGMLKYLLVLNLSTCQLEKLPKSIIKLLSLEFLDLRNNDNLQITVEQKIWLEKLEEKGCRVEIDKKILQKHNKTKDSSQIKIELSTYSKYIQSIENPNFEKIRRYCNNLLNTNKADKMQEYLAENGKMYKALIYDALEQFIMQLQESTETLGLWSGICYEPVILIDWCCGQGIASMLVLNYIKEKQLDIKVSEVILIDNDTETLSRAMVQVEALADGIIKFTSVKSDDYSIYDTIKPNNTVLNLFANDKMSVDFLDIDYDIFEEAYFMCVSNKDKVFVDDVYKNISDFLDVQDVSIRDGRIGRFNKYERIFKTIQNIPHIVIDEDEIP